MELSSGCAFRSSRYRLVPKQIKTKKMSMKKNLLVTGMAVFFIAAGICPTWADNGYRHDNHGYWDGNHHRHNYAYHHHHRGYWDQRNGVRVFIGL